MYQNKHQTLFSSLSPFTETKNSRRSCQINIAEKRRAICEAGTAYPTGATELTPDSCLFLCIFFPLTIVFYVLPRFTTSDYTFCIFKLFLWQQYARRQSISLCITQSLTVAISFLLISRTYVCIINRACR